MTELALRSRARRTEAPAPRSARSSRATGRSCTGAKLDGAARARPGARPPGFIGWLATVDHKEIGRRYIVTALVFLALGGVLALLMRLQLARPDNDLIGAARYNELFTMHGTTMMFLFAVPVMEGVAVYIMPLMIGTRSTAFPRLNAFSYYMYLFGGLLLWGAFALNIGPDIGWFAYTPLSGPAILARQARRHLGADDHLHRSRRARRGGGAGRDHPQDARAGHDPGADAAVRLGDAGDVA